VIPARRVVEALDRGEAGALDVVRGLVPPVGSGYSCSEYVDQGVCRPRNRVKPTLPDDSQRQRPRRLAAGQKYNYYDPPK